ncbi:MAG: VWA domain-containing protein [Planctomycetales bacterium]|nr:VWA domain-containing protein [Planctomycetales bacterium]
MFEHSLTFDRPVYLLLLGLLPLFWVWARGGLSGMGTWRRRTALGLRIVVATLLIFSLADAQYQRRSDRMTVVYVLDQSLSIPADQRQAMLEFVHRSVKERPADAADDRFAVIVFGRDAEVEIPLVDTELALHNRVESLVDSEYTDLATALQRAKALFPYDASRRIVLVTDGNQNIGDAYREARSAAGSGVSIDVVPVQLTRRQEVSVEKVDVPNGVRKGQPFELRVVLNNDSDADSPGSVVHGKLSVVRKTPDRTELVVEQDVTLPPGKRVFTIPETIESSDFYTYEARFSPADAGDDGMPQNNVASAFTHVRGKGHVLVIENFNSPGEFDYLIDELRKDEIEVSVVATNQLFTSLAELQRYDVVVLANVPRSSGEGGADVASFSDEQISMLTRNTREMGCGLIMLGGAETYGAGGWTNTELEEAMPVDFQITSSKVVPVGALVMMMHAGEIPKANYWQKRIAVEAIKLLGARDYCGLVQWNQTDQWLWGQSQGGLMRVGANRKMMLSRVDRMMIGDMPSFEGAMKMAASAFSGAKDASVRHMIIISDGDPTPPTSSTVNLLLQQGVKISTVAVGSHGLQGSAELQRLARVSGGKYYNVTNASALPRIYQREARRIGRPLVYEPPSPVVPRVIADHEILRGVEAGVPAISGYVLTTVKEHPLVEVLLQSPLPAEEKHATVLAAWPYGAGKSVALTTDAGHRWASSWTGWDGYNKIFSQMVRWAMRPQGDAGNYSVSTNLRDGKTEIVVTAIDDDEQFVNSQTITASAVAPDMTHIPVRIQQTAPGRYVGQFDSEMAGSYLIVVNPGSGAAPIRTGVNVGYSTEYLDRETNEALLASLAALPAGDGPVGELLAADTLREAAEPSQDYTPFRRDLPKAVSNQSIWPWLVVAGCAIFWSDVFVRRVHVEWAWFVGKARAVADKFLRRQPIVKEPETMSRLRSRKREIGAELDTRRAATRFEIDPDAKTDVTAPARVEGAKGKAAPSTRSAPEAPGGQPDPGQQESYTERLLKAKKQVWKDKDQSE